MLCRHPVSYAPISSSAQSLVRRFAGLTYGVWGCQDAVTETSTLGSIVPPEIDYKLCLPKATILEGRLTDLQIETILYACAQVWNMVGLHMAVKA
eukprot:1493496-Rhodomonas_salina.1